MISRWRMKIPRWSMSKSRPEKAKHTPSCFFSTVFINVGLDWTGLNGKASMRNMNCMGLLLSEVTIGICLLDCWTRYDLDSGYLLGEPGVVGL